MDRSNLNRIFRISVIAILLLFSAEFSMAELSSQSEAELVGNNWIQTIVHQKGAWAGSTNPSILNSEEIRMDGELLGYALHINPVGYIIVPVLKEMVPVKAYSFENNLDLSESDGVSLMLKEMFSNRYESYKALYGSLSASQPVSGDVMFGRSQKESWNELLQDEATFKASLSAKAMQTDEFGPLLTSVWHQNDPYNLYCPWGDGGRTVVGCVATAAAQIMKYYEWPPQGTYTKSFYWSGDNSCDGNTAGEMLFADFTDAYDWANIPDYCNNCNAEQEAAVAELNYEVGVAFSMSYGRCGSGAYTADAMEVFPQYFRYKDIIEQHYRTDYGLMFWSDIIRAEIENSRPCQYRIMSHSIVCDGWRQSDIYYQVHMNYGWGGSNNLWYTIDDLHCNWEGCSPSVEYILTNITPDNGVHFTADTTWGNIPLEVQFEGISDLLVDTWYWDFGDGNYSNDQSPKHTYWSPGQYDVTLDISAEGEPRSYAVANLVTILADTACGLNAQGEAGEDVAVSVYACNTVELQNLKVPVSYTGDLNLYLDSFSTAGCRSDGFDVVKQVSSDPFNKRTAFSFYNTESTSSNLDPGSGPILKMFFSIPETATGDQSAEIEIIDYSSHSLMFKSAYLEYTPVREVSMVTFPYICGDVNQSASQNIIDITYLIAYLYSGGTEPMPYNSADVNNSGAVNIIDVTYLIAFLYNGGPLPNCP